MTPAERATTEPLSPTQFILLLHSVPHIGEKALTRLLRLFAQQRTTPEAFLALSERELKRQFDLRPQAIAHLAAYRDALVTASAELARTARACHIHVITIESAAYPARLERNDDAPPPVLYALGNRALLDTKSAAAHPAFTFALATSNDAPPLSLVRQDEIGAELSALGGIVVTGHDRKPYQRAALSAQRQNKPILYVFDRGLREALGPAFDRPPFAAARIRDAVFDPVRDLAVSSFRLDDHAIGANLRRRDRILFALADVIIAHDLRAGGGMIAECLRAREQGQRVYVSPGGRDGNDELRGSGFPTLPADLTELL